MINWPTLCEAITTLPPHVRRKIIEKAIENGYAAKDIAEIIGVSPPAVSRYLHGSLSPSPGAVCRLIMGVEKETKLMMIKSIAKELWKLTYTVINQIHDTHEGYQLIEEIADTIAALLDKHKPNI